MRHYTSPKDSPQEGQKTLYTEALLGAGTRLTVTGKTEFPNYGATVYVGKVTMGGNGKLNMEKGTIFASEDRGLRLTVQLNGVETAIAVKSMDEKSGTFVALLPDIPLKTGEPVRPITREVAGRIDAENGQAILSNTAVKGPILKPRETPGFWEAGPEVTGNGYIQLKENKITLNTDRLVNLLDYKNLEERKPVWTTTMSDRYDTAMSAFADSDNNLIIRSGGLVLATAMVAPKFVEETVSFVVESVHPAREFAVHSFLAVHEKDPVEKLRAAGKAADNFGEFFIRAEAGATAAVTAGALVVREGTPIIRNAVRSVSKFLEKPTTLPAHPARSLGAAAQADLADPALTTYEYVRLDGGVVKPTSQTPTLTPSRALPQAQNVRLESSPTNVSGLSRMPKYYDYVNRGPLSPDVAETFSGSRYVERVLSEDTLLYRVYGGKAKEVGRNGTFLTTVEPAGGLKSKIDSALRPEWENTADRIAVFRVPKGTTIYEGTAVSQGEVWIGGKPQVFIQQVFPEWIIEKR